jgi:HK97 family phage portal protein
MTVAPWSIGRVPVRPRDGSLIPPPGSSLGGAAYVWDTFTARRIPAVGRCIQLYGGMCKQMSIDAYRGDDLVDPRPRLLDRPDPDEARSWFVQVSVEDYLLDGNAVARVTSRNRDGWPTTVKWLPSVAVFIMWWPGDPRPSYFYYGEEIPYADVIHIKRGADRLYPARGVGVVEEHLATLDRAAMEEEYERSTLAGSSVPSVAVIAPGQVTQEVADEAKGQWVAKFAGPVREPAILPNGTQVIPLAWSPSDTQLIEARKLTLVDIANLFNIDSYWLGAPVAGMTYKTASPQYQQILRTSLEPVLADFEDGWSNAWLPRGTVIHFDRNKLLSEDLPTSALALSTLTAADIISADEARAYLMGRPFDLSGPAPKPKPPPPAPVPPVAPGPAADPEEDPEEENP